MTRIVTTAAVILILTIATGCTSDTGISNRLPQRSTPALSEPPAPTTAAVSAPANSGEIDLVEQMASHRLEYRRSLQSLIQFYNTAGNNQKMSWARSELEALDRIPQYRYFVMADLPENLKAAEQIPAADQLYAEAEKLRRDAGLILPAPLKDEEKLRAAVDKYSQVISQYPNSDKIDDAAYRMGEIHDYFNDYVLAVSCFQRTYQWDPATSYPARFKAAFIMDRKLRNRSEALKIYQEAVVKESQYTDYRLMAERRIQELNNSGGATK